MKLKLLTLATALMLSATASADFIIDTGANHDFGITDADNFTNSFTGFILNPISPTSNYIDLNNNGFVDTGEPVIDTGTTTVASLLGVSNANAEFYGSTWDFDVSWTLLGVAGVTGGTNTQFGDEAGLEVLGASFFGGEMIFNFNSTLVADIDAAITLEVTGSAVDDPTTGIGFEIYGDITAVEPGFLLKQNGDPLDLPLNMVAETDLNGLEVVPTDQGGTFGDLDAATKAIFTSIYGFIDDATVLLTRTANVNSTDITAVPAPATLGVFGIALLALAGLRRRKF